MSITLTTTNLGVAAILEKILARVLAEGGQVHPAAHLVEQQGQLQVLWTGSHRLSKPSAEAPLLFNVPRSLLVPVQGAVWAPHPDRLELQQEPPGLTAVQQELLHLKIELYNATDKLKRWQHSHPRSGLSQSPAIADLLLRLGRHRTPDPVDSPAEAFLSTRTFGLSALPEECTDMDKTPRTPVLLPLIDLLNHHHRGAPFQVDGQRMTIRAAGAGNECFAHYGGRRDVLDLALHYGYCDPSTPFAHCPPLDLQVPALGRVRVLGQRRRPAHPNDPPQVSLDAEGLTISHLCCHRAHPQRVQVMLRLALEAAARRQGVPSSDCAAAVTQAMQQIGATNLTLLEKLQQRCLELSTTYPSAPMLAAAAQRQAEIVRSVLGSEATA